MQEHVTCGMFTCTVMENCKRSELFYRSHNSPHKISPIYIPKDLIGNLDIDAACTKSRIVTKSSKRCVSTGYAGTGILVSVLVADFVWEMLYRPDA